MRILMVGSEAAPYAKTGGLSDVLGALPQALRELGHEAAVLLPRYAQTRKHPMRRIWDTLPVTLRKTYSCSVFQSEADPAYLFLDAPEFFDRDGLYSGAAGDYPDNHLRFALLAKGALEVVRYIFAADILHCHDWQAGLAPAYLRYTLAGDPTFFGLKTLTTIHNLGYQGLFPPETLEQVGLPAALLSPEGLEFYGNVSYLKSGLFYSDALSTVSRKYAAEIQTPEYGFGMEGLLRARERDLHGILNGVDYAQWDPRTDRRIPATYSAEDLSGKAECKRELLREFGLPGEAMERPLVGIVSRFTGQKGFDLIAAAAGRLFEEGISLVALGNGERSFEDLFLSLEAHNPGRAAVRIGFDEGMAHRIEAGADMFLMPSRYEPCGLNQIYSLRYGTPPVVRATGGLDDTVDAETGFKFQEYTPDALVGAVREAVSAYDDHEAWEALMRNGMARDHSWGRSAREYGKLYAGLLNPKFG